VPAPPLPGSASPDNRGLARERTHLAWTRSGLALLVCVSVLLRHLWPLHGTEQVVALSLIAAACILWGLAVLTLTSRLRAPAALHGARTFRLVTAGTVLLALVGFVLAFFGPST
jgi:uncharacterized membrane protein YidH (DUF202 family)